MLKKYYLALLLLIFSCNAVASVWGDVSDCLSDPCNCGQGDRTETWNAGTVNEVKKTFKPGSLCPPWNKSDGRDEDTCLLQYDHPDTFIGFYLKRCAEATASSSYFSPKIRIRIQSCNAAACWSQSSTLNWDGECVLWPTSYSLPLTRICARVAIPETPPPPGLNTQGNPADPGTQGNPGYTAGKHLNEVGYVENDDTIIGVDGAVITLQSPKLCAYSDPGLVNLVSDSGVNTDAMDWNPNSQPLHKTTELSPIAKVLKFLVDTAGGANLPNLLSSLLDMMGAENSEILKVFKTVFKAIGEIFNFFPSLIIEVIKVFGSLNSAVDNYSFGCVQLPFGPYPPPFCPSLNELTVSPLLHNICSQKNSDGITFNQSSTISPCVVSNVANNVINNAVRVSFNNLVPLCSGASPDLTTCIELKNIEPFSSAQGAHLATTYTDLIKACSSATADAPCVNTAIPLSCSVMANGCNQGFRIVYSQKIGTSSTPSDYYISDLPDCGAANANNSTTCQEIWGVNIGEFIDISVKFPMVQNQTDLTPLQQTFSLKDNNNKARNFYASIVNKANVQQSPADICVFESASLVDCQARADKGYSLVTYKCGEHAGLNCPDNTYYTPQFIASMQVRDDSNNILAETNTIVTPLSFTGSPNSTAIETIATLAGYDFSSSVAYIPAIPPKSPADKYIAMPFSGPNSLNQSTIYGTYKNNETPYDASGQVNPNAVYLKYLEYINGKYIQGGTHACLMPKDFQHCVPMIPPSNPNIPTPSQNTQINCTLAKLTESDTVDCQTFQGKSILYPNLGICPNDISSCTQKEVVAGNGKGITIYSCGITNCYTNNDKANTPVCVLSRDYQNRIYPAPDKGPILTDSQYYAVKYDKDNNYIVPGSDQTYTLAVADVRDKTSQELNLCVSILGICSAITTPSNDSGNATWPETDIGDLAKGTCQPNWITIDPNKPLERYCSSNFDSKTVAFEKLAPDVGCRESKGITIEDPDSNFPENVDSTNQYDDSSKIGSFTLNKEPQDNGAFPEDVIITQGLYHAIYKFEIDSIIDDIEYFEIKKVAYDDCVLIKINDQKVLSEPTDVNDFNLNTCNDGKDQGDVRFTTNVPIDVKSKLKQGTNTISFQLGVRGKGGLYYHMEYKMRR